MKVILISVFSLCMAFQTASAEDTKGTFSASAPEKKSNPVSYLQFSHMAEALLNIGIIDECTYSSSLIALAYPNNGPQTGWVVPNDNDDSGYAEIFDEAAANLSAAISISLDADCPQPANNKRCCVQATIEKCRSDPTKNCRMDAGNQWCTTGSHGC